MKTEVRQTALWLWGIARNPDMVWLDANTQEEVSRGRWKRIDRFHILRPMWMYYFLTTNPGCGCRKRFGLWHTITCSEHAGLNLGEDQEDDEEDE